jgi:hypothetical protein
MPALIPLDFSIVANLFLAPGACPGDCVRFPDLFISPPDNGW